MDLVQGDIFDYLPKLKQSIEVSSNPKEAKMADWKVHGQTFMNFT